MTANYSTVVTWSYFLAYTILFAIVSIYCAIKVLDSRHKELDGAQIPPMSKKKIFSKWWSALLKKKKVYLQLVPHFFDQATDLGTIMEYYSFRDNKEISNTINTMYLFYISIFIIIFHKIVSSAAIYHLTKKKSFFFYQLFDLLLVRCVWINYKLNIDEPSNAQRYLQVLEAILESAPQLLVSSAFLIKTDIYSPIILLSLITSFWTLTSRVVADDKQMVDEEWKEIEFLKEKKCPFFNYRYLIRVICWRFLEISSRITLLCLIWINLGGFAVIILIWLEIAYLSIICFGVGSFGMLCNIIYLTASSSTQKSSNIYWAVSMAKVFWAYRILSSWLFLIMITISATIKFEAWKVDDYATRNELTFNQDIGLFFYIFTWIAQPIWQWVCTVVVFEYNNLHSISRDVQQLSEQNQWKDVMELLSFGAYDIDYEYLYISCTEQAQFDFYGGAPRKHLYSKQVANACLKQFYYINEAKNVFFRNIFYAHKQSASFMIDQGFNVDTTDNHGRTALHYAASSNNWEMVRMLIKQKKCDCSIKDNDGLTALHFAILNLDRNIKETEDGIQLNILQCMIEDGHCDVCTTDNNSISLFDTAQLTQNKNIITKLISYGALLDFSNNDTPFFMGCYQGFITVIEKALKENLDINITDKTNRNRSGLHYALISTAHNKQTVIEFLIHKNMNVNIKDDDGFTPLHLALIAVPNLNKNILKYLLNDAKCDVNSSDNDGYSPIDAALFKKSPFAIDILVEYGAIINTDKYNEDKLIDFYFTMCYDGCINVIKYLISNNIININTVDINSRNGLHYACIRNNELLIKCLIELNIDIDSKDYAGFSPLHLMIHQKKGSVFRSPFKQSILDLLINDANCNVNSMDNNGNTILQTAQKKQPQNIRSLLINNYNATRPDTLYKYHDIKIKPIQRKPISLLLEYTNSDILLNTEHLNLEQIDDEKDEKKDEKKETTEKEKGGESEKKNRNSLDNEITVETAKLLQDLEKRDFEWTSKKSKTIKKNSEKSGDVEWMISNLESVSFFNIGVSFCSILLIFAFFFGIHIMALIVNNSDICNESIYINNASILYNYHNYINYGCSVYLALMTFTVILGLIFYFDLFCCEWSENLFETQIVRYILYIGLILFGLWLFAWCVIGFVLYSNISTENILCRDVVLTLSIFELIQFIILCVLISYIFIQLRNEYEYNRAADDKLYALKKESGISKKMILLGSGFVGKTTIFRQIKRLFGDGFNEEEREWYKEMIQNQIIESMRYLIGYVEDFRSSYPEEFGDLTFTSAECEHAAEKIYASKWDTKINEEIANYIEILWNENAIQTVYEQRQRVFIKESSAYFFDNVFQIASSDYKPTDEEMLYVSWRTTGIIQNEFNIKNNIFNVVDTGGQRCERRKWIHCFERVNAVLFVASLSNYDEVLFEDHKSNAMQDQIELFGNICNLQWFTNSDMILLLNKFDLFRLKVQDVPLSVCFEDYVPNNDDDYGDDTEVDNAVNFIKGKFLELNKTENKMIYTHITCAVDTDNFQKLLNDIQHQIILNGFRAVRMKSMKTMKSLKYLDLDLL